MPSKIIAPRLLSEVRMELLDGESQQIPVIQLRNMINDRSFFITSSHLSTLVGFNEDRIQQELERKNIVVGRMLRVEKHTHLYESIVQKYPAQINNDHLLLFPLQNVIDIFNIFQSCSRRLHHQISAMLERLEKENEDNNNDTPRHILLEKFTKERLEGIETILAEPFNVKRELVDAVEALEQIINDLRRQVGNAGF